MPYGHRVPYNYSSIQVDALAYNGANDRLVRQVYQYLLRRLFSPCSLMCAARKLRERMSSGHAPGAS